MDMVTMNIIDSAMVAICREMGVNVQKTAYSTIFSEAEDFIKFSRYEQNSSSFVALLHDATVDEFDGPNVNAASWLGRDQELDVFTEFTTDDQLLFVSPAQARDSHGDARRSNIEFFDYRLGVFVDNFSAYDASARKGFAVVAVEHRIFGNRIGGDYAVLFTVFRDVSNAISCDLAGRIIR